MLKTFRLENFHFTAKEVVCEKSMFTKLGLNMVRALRSYRYVWWGAEGSGGWGGGEGAWMVQTGTPGSLKDKQDAVARRTVDAAERRTTGDAALLYVARLE